MNLVTSRSFTALVLACASTVTPAEQASIIAPPTMDNVVAVEIQSIDGSVIKGRLINRTPHRVAAPELMAKYDWLWHDDHHPGPDDPGWVTYTVLAQDLAPNASVPFTIDPGRRLPERNDGQFMTSVAVTRVTEFKLPPVE